MLLKFVINLKAISFQNIVMMISAKNVHNIQSWICKSRINYQFEILCLLYSSENIDGNVDESR